MDSADVVATPLGAWASIRGYFTPATLFLVVNIVIGTIALTSRATQQRRRRQDHHHHYHDDAHGHYHLQDPHQQQQAYGDPYYQQQQPLYYATPPAPLVRTSSVLDRLRSFGLYRFRSGDFPPEYGAAPIHAQDAFAPVEEESTTQQSRSVPAPAREEERRPVSRVKKPAAASEVRKAQVAPPPARVVEAAVAEDDAMGATRVEEFSAARFRREPSPLQQEYNYQEEYVPPPARRAPAPAPLARTSSFMDRLRSLGSMGLPTFLASEQPTDSFATPATAAPEKKQAQAQHYDRSRSEPAWEQGGNKEKKKQETKSKMAKSSSETRKTAAPTTLAEAGLAIESVDARAEAFIDSFKQQQAQHHREYVPPPLSRAPSVLERICSFGLSRFRSGDLGPDLPAAEAAATPAAAAEKKQAAAGTYARSRSEPAPKQVKKEPRISKSSSSVVEEETPAEGEQECVDARADDFINKFRQQLQLQRLNSLLNYKEVLNRGKQ